MSNEIYSVSFNKMLVQFFEWVKKVDYYVKDVNGVVKEWELTMLDDFVEPGRNKLEVFLKTLVEKYIVYKGGDIISKDTKWIKNIIHEYKQCTKTLKKRVDEQEWSVSDTFKKELKKFIKWVDEMGGCVVTSKKKAIQLTWQEIDLKEFKEPARNKLQMYIDHVLKDNIIHLNECVITSSLEILNIYKNSTKLNKTQAKAQTNDYENKFVKEIKYTAIKRNEKEEKVDIVEKICKEMSEEEICLFNGDMMEILTKYTSEKIKQGIRKGLDKIMENYILVCKDYTDSQSEVYDVNKENSESVNDNVSDSVADDNSKDKNDNISDIYEEELKGEYYKDDELMISLEKELNAVNLDTDISDDEEITLDDIEI